MLVDVMTQVFFQELLASLLYFGSFDINAPKEQSSSFFEKQKFFQ